MAQDHLAIGSLLFEDVDQIDLTGPFEVLSRLPDSSCRIYGLSDRPVRDVMGLRLAPDASIDDAPALDVLHIPGGPGQQRLMEDDRLQRWLQHQSQGARAVFSVCTGALLLGSAGLLRGRRATTHWASWHLLPLFGATAVDQRVVVDGDWVFAAGVTAGIDGALQLAAQLRGQRAAERIQLDLAYAPEPPFCAGDPATAPVDVVAEARTAVAPLIAKREQTARAAAARLGIAADTPVASRA